MSWHGAITIVVAVSIPVFLGFIGYWHQEKSKRRAELSERRRVLYESLVQSLIGLLGARTPKERSRLLTEIETGWLFAADAVLEACYRYLAAYDGLCSSVMGEEALDWNSVLTKIRSDADARVDLGTRLSDVFVEMRRDLKKDTKITRDWARRNVDVYCWGIVSAGEHAASEWS